MNAQELKQLAEAYKKTHLLLKQTQESMFKAGVTLDKEPDWVNLGIALERASEEIRKKFIELSKPTKEKHPEKYNLPTLEKEWEKETPDEQDPENEDKTQTTTTKLGLDLEKGAVDFERTTSVGDHERSIQAQLSGNGITLGAKYKIEHGFKVPTIPLFRSGIADVTVKIEPKLGLELQVGTELLSNRMGASAKLEITGGISATPALTLLQILELSIKFSLDASASIAAKVWVDKTGGMIELGESELKLKGDISFHIGPSELIKEIASVIIELLEESGIVDDVDTDPQNWGWSTEITSGEIASLNIPAKQIPFQSRYLGFDGIDFGQLVHEALDKADGFVGAVYKIYKIVKDVIEWIEGAIDSIGDALESMADAIGDALEAAGDFIVEIFQTEEERRAAARKLASESAFQQIVAAAMEKMKKQAVHIKALDGKGFLQRMHYTISVVWPQVARDPFVQQCLRMMQKGDIIGLMKNRRIATGSFSIEQVGIEGTRNGDAFVLGETLRISLDLRKDEDMVQRLLNRVQGEKSFKAMVTATAYCNGEPVSHIQQPHAEIIDKDMPMSNAIQLALPLPTSDRFPDSLNADWKLAVRIDFWGDVMDVVYETPIRVTIHPAQELSEPAPIQSVYPEIKGLTIKGEKTGDLLVQGQRLAVITRVAIEHLEQEDPLEGVLAAMILHDGKPIGKTEKINFKLSPPFALPKVLVTIPEGYSETVMGGNWKVAVQVKMKDMPVLKVSKPIKVTNTKRDYTAPEEYQTMADDMEQE